MSRFIRHPRDFWSGVMFMCFGLAAVVIGQDYPMGTGGRMGAAYFPVVLGVLLSLIGLATTLRSLRKQGERIENFSIRDTALVLGSVFLFGALVRAHGIALACGAGVLASLAMVSAAVAVQRRLARTEASAGEGSDPGSASR